MSSMAAVSASASTSASAELLLRPHVESALRCIIAPPPSTSSQEGGPETIQRAQEALLRWEESNTDDYALCLVSLVGGSTVASSSSVVEPVENGASSSSAAATLRLAAALALKAAVSRRWKDRGRGKLGAKTTLLCEDVKSTVRRSMLGLVLAGNIGQSDRIKVCVTDANQITIQQLELIRDRALQTNTASLLAKIARMDLPLKFHELIPTLVEGFISAQTAMDLIKQQPPSQETHQQLMVFRTVQRNVMASLEGTLAEISTQRLLVDKKYRNSIAAQYLGPVVEHGLMPSLRELESSTVDGANVTEVTEEERPQAVEYAALASRTVSYMMASSFTKLAEDPTTAPLVREPLGAIHSLLSRWLPLVLDGGRIVGAATTTNGGSIRATMEDLLCVHCDLVVTLQRSHPVPFGLYLGPFLHLFHSLLMGPVVGATAGGQNRGGPAMNAAALNGSARRPGRFAIAFLSFIANVVGTSEYSEPGSVRDELASFLTPPRVRTLSRILLQLFSIHIVPTIWGDGGGDDDDDEENDDAVRWQDDSEGFYHWENTRSSEEDVGCAAQNLFLALAESPFSSGVVGSWLWDHLTNVVSQRLAVELEGGISANMDERIVAMALPLGAPPANLVHREDGEVNLLLQWDAIYTAAGLSVGMLEGRSPGFDFRTWFDKSLGHCLALFLQGGSRQRTQPPILQRRIIWLLSCNAHQVAVSSPLNPLGMVVSALSTQTDVCVRLTAVQALDALLPQCEGSPSVLLSIVERTVPALYRLTNECAEVESRSACLDLLSNLISYVGVTGGSITNEILNIIVAPLSTIWGNAVGHNLLLKRNVLTVLSSIASLVGPEGCGVLYPLALPMVDDSLSREENVFLVEEALKIWWVFLRLSRTYDPLLGKLFVRAVNLSKDLEHMMILMRITEHYIILGGATFLNDHMTEIQSVLCNIVGEVRPRGTAYIFLVIEALLRSFPVEGGSLLQGCGVLKTFVEACASSYFEDDKCEPDRVIVFYLTALARTSLSNPSALQGLLPVRYPSGVVFGEDELISLYLQKFEVAGNGAHGLLFQKLWGLLLLSFYPPSQYPACCNAVLGKSNTTFRKFVYVLQNTQIEGTNILSYDVGHDEQEETVDIGAEMYEALFQEQRTKDVVLTTSFHECVSAKMKSLPMELGGKYQEFLSTIDQSTLQQLEAALLNNHG